MKNLTANWVSAKELSSSRKVSDRSLQRWVQRSQHGGYYPPDLEAQDGIHYIVKQDKATPLGWRYLFNRNTITSVFIRRIKEWGEIKRQVYYRNRRIYKPVISIPPLEPYLRGKRIFCKVMKLRISMEHCRMCYLSKNDRIRSKITWKECRNQNARDIP